jgi:WD40 repeat protein
MTRRQGTLLFLALVLCTCERPERVSPPAAAREPKPPGTAGATHTDCYGDPLPDGAIGRLGTIRFRLSNSLSQALLSSDGKHVILRQSGDKRVVFLDAVTGEEKRRLDLPDALPVDFAVVRHEKFLLTAPTIYSADMHLLDPATGRTVKQFPAEGSFLSSVPSLSADGRRLANSVAEGKEGGDKKLFAVVWDVETGKRIAAIPDDKHSNGFAVFLSPDGKRLAACQNYHQDADLKNILRTGAVQSVFVWDVDSGKELYRIDSEGSVVRGAAFSPNGKQLALLENGSVVSVWDAATGKLIHRLAGLPAPLSWLRYSPDGEQLVASAEGGIQRWDAASGKRLAPLSGPPGEVIDVVFMPEKKMRLLSRDNLALHVWDAPEGGGESKPEGPSQVVRGLRFSADGQKVYSLADDGVFLWEAKTGKLLRRIRHPELGSNSLYCSLLSPDGRRLLHFDALTGGPRMVESATGDLLADFSVPRLNEGYAAACFAARAPLAAFAVRDDDQNDEWFDLHVWNLETCEEVARFTHKGKGEIALALSADGARLALARQILKEETPPATEFAVYDAATGKERWKETCKGHLGLSLEFSPDGARLASAGRAGGVRRLNANNGKEIGAFDIDDKWELQLLRYAPDGCTVAVAVKDRNDATAVKTLWLETATGKVRAEFPSDVEQDRTLAFSPDGRVLATGNSDTTVTLWDLTGGVDPKARPDGERTPEKMESLWAQLADPDARVGWEAVKRLIASPEQSTALICKNLPPAERGFTDADLARWIADLDADDFDRREEATKALRRVGPVAEEALRKALEANPSAEKKARLLELHEAAELGAPRPELVRPTRALEVLERVGTPEAKQVLEELAKGDPDAQLTRDAKATLDRLDAGRTTGKP